MAQMPQSKKARRFDVFEAAPPRVTQLTTLAVLSIICQGGPRIAVSPRPLRPTSSICCKPRSRARSACGYNSRGFAVAAGVGETRTWRAITPIET